MTSTITLYRPVGKSELDLIRDSGFTMFPPRLPDQPVFYPVLTEEYAIQIARDWNSTDAEGEFLGFVTEFDIDANYISKFEIRTAGSSIHREYWIPAEDLEEFNSHIVGPIRVTAEFRKGKLVG